MESRTSYISKFIAGAFLLLIPLQSMADHPNEGAFTLEQLIKEAEAQNFEIKEAESTYKSSQAQADAKYGKISASPFCGRRPANN